MSSALLQWEQETTNRWRRRLSEFGAMLRRSLRAILLAGVAFLLGVHAATAPNSPLADIELRRQLRATAVELNAREGELELARLELGRVKSIIEYSKTYQIPADLAQSIYDIALAEGIDPGLAYRLISVESGFYSRAVSPVGAVGLTQVMPRTAFGMDPSLDYRDLFERETNLRLGFRYLRLMLAKYEGDLRLALLAYLSLIHI